MGGDLDRFMDFTGLIPGADGGIGALDNTYGVPGTGAGGYNAPGSGYDTPQATYGQATYGSGNRVDFDFNIPMDGQVEVNKIFRAAPACRSTTQKVNKSGKRRKILYFFSDF